MSASGTSRPGPERVLVSAGAEKQALATARSLGRAGYRVAVLNSKTNTPSFWSRHCHEALLAPSNQDTQAYTRFLLQDVETTPTLTILPCDDATAGILSRERQRFAAHVRLALPPPESFEIAVDKSRLVRFAEPLGIPVPRSLHPASLDEAERTGADLGFPLIVKGSAGWGAQHVRLVLDRTGLRPAAEAIAALEGGRLPMLQEYVPGTGCGFTTLFRHGEPRAVFMHARAAEFDLTLDPSRTPYSCPVAVSIDDPRLRGLGLRLFEALAWHGVGMAEWRRDARDGRYVLMEINPRLVGSTDLAIRSGVDLPALAARLAGRGDVEPVLQHRTGVRLQWLVPDGLKHFMAQPGQALRTGLGRVHSDWSWRDPAPHWVQLRLAAWDLRQRRRR